MKKKIVDDPDAKKNRKTSQQDTDKQTTEEMHLGSSNAFEETENPQSPDPDSITDELLDDLLDQ
ncbi:MAG TPA: hypothetical protein VG890_09295 [Puia sp.]|nr:hypothetical protein [Puia sp.]